MLQGNTCEGGEMSLHKGEETALKLAHTKFLRALIRIFCLEHLYKKTYVREIRPLTGARRNEP